jgi:hypothetical protein
VPYCGRKRLPAIPSTVRVQAPLPAPRRHRRWGAASRHDPRWWLGQQAAVRSEPSPPSRACLLWMPLVQVGYIKVESVQLAVQLLDQTEFRPGSTISVIAEQ